MFDCIKSKTKIFAGVGQFLSPQNIHLSQRKSGICLGTLSLGTLSFSLALWTPLTKWHLHWSGGAELPLPRCGTPLCYHRTAAAKQPPQVSEQDQAMCWGRGNRHCKGGTWESGGLKGAVFILAEVRVLCLQFGVETTIFFP